MKSQVTLRPVVERDLVLLEQLFTDPAATGEFEWYGWQDSRWLRRQWDDNGLLGEDTGMLMVADAGGGPRFVSWRKRTSGYRSFCWAIGVKLMPEARGRGHGSEAQPALVRYLFSHTQAVRIEAETDVMNVPEQHALEAAGFTREGVLRSVTFRAGTWRDGVICSVLRSEIELGDP